MYLRFLEPDITDPNGNVTTFNRDLQSRVYQKIFADSTTIDYLFEGQTAPNTAGATSRLKSSTDALKRKVNYSVFDRQQYQPGKLHQCIRISAESSDAIGGLHLRSELQPGDDDD